MRLYTINLPGNLHECAALINASFPEIIPGIVVMDCPSGRYTIIVYRAEAEHPKLAPKPRAQP